MQPQEIYDAKFYQQQKNISVQAARKFLALLFSHYIPQSVLDIGCGSGSWLKVAQDLGAKTVLGIDGNKVEQDELYLPRNCIESVDLNEILSGQTQSQILTDNPHFDLAMSLEVAEHLPETASRSLVDLLTQKTDVVLFSAALPHQDGCHHINCQNVDYWVNFFHGKGYICIDMFRPTFMFDDSLTAWWYGQNAFLYVKQSVMGSFPSLKKYESNHPMSFYHEYIVNRLVDPETSLGYRIERKLRKWLKL